MANELKTAEMLSSKVTSDKQDNVQSQNNPSNRDVNGVNDRNALTRDKHLANDSKTILDKKPTANGDIKPPSSLPELKKEKSALKTPTKKISPKSPEIGSANSLGDKKKVPMNKVQVGAAPSPNLKVVRSKIGSLENYTHKPGGGKVKIENRKLEWKVQPKIEAKNDKYAPSGGDKKITQVKLQWSAKSKIGSLDNATHRPGGGDKKIESVKLDFKDKAKPKVGSKDNIKHVPGGGTVKKTTDVDAKSTSSNIEEQKLDIKAQSKVGSLDNVKHRPGGGDKKIFDDKEYLKQTALTNESSKANSVTTSGSQAPEDSQICSRDSQQKENQVVAASTIASKKSDKPAKDQLKPKHESTNESPKNDKKSQPTTPKKSLRLENASPQKITQKPDTKVDQKPKPESMPQIKPELKKIPSVEKIKPDSSKSKVPVAQTHELVKMPSKEKITFRDSKIPTQQTQKPILEPVSKPQEKSSSGSENLPKLGNKDITKKENNNNVEITAINRKSSEKSVDTQGPKNELNLTTKPLPEIIFKKQDSKSKIEPPKSNIDLDKKPSAEVIILKKDSIPKTEPKSNLDISKIAEEKKESNKQISDSTNVDNRPPVDVIIPKKQDPQSKIEPPKSNTDIDKKPPAELKKQNSKSKIEPPKSNIDPDKKPSAEVIILKKDSIPKTEPKSNLDTSKIAEEKRESNKKISNSINVDNKPPVEVIIPKKQDPQSKIEPPKSNTGIDEKPPVELEKQDSKSKIEPPKSNVDPDKKPPAEVIILKKDPIPKTEPKSNLDTSKIAEEKKESNIQNSKPINVVEVIEPKKQDLQSRIELKSNLDAGKTEEKKESNMQDSKLTNVDKDTKPPIDVIILKKQDPPSKIEPNPKSNLDAGKTEEKKESVQDLKSKSISAENKSNLGNVVSTKEQIQPVSNADLNKSNLDINNKSLNKDSNDTNLKSNFENKPSENKDQRSKSDDLNSKLVDEKSKKIDVIIPNVKPNSEKIPQPEVKQTSETFSPISKPETESKTSITTTDGKSISESKLTTEPAQEVKLLSSRETGDESKPVNNQILDFSKTSPQNTKAPSSASSTSSSKQ